MDQFRCCRCHKTFKADKKYKTNAGKGLIELIDTGDGNIALLIAGYSATDTRAATGVVANYGDYELEGDAMEVVTATSTVKEVSEAVVAEEETEETV